MTTRNVRSKVRLSLDVSPELNDLLEELATATHSTKSEVLRKAIALMDVAVDAKESGQKLWVSNQPPAGTSREIVGI
jgi:predicted transcriptional regulator